MLGGQLDRLDLAPEPGAVALDAILGDLVALGLEPLSEFLIAAEGAFSHAVLQFSPHLCRQHCYFRLGWHQRASKRREEIGERK
jgi:hypothetical protein